MVSELNDCSHLFKFALVELVLVSISLVSPFPFTICDSDCSTNSFHGFADVRVMNKSLTYREIDVLFVVP